MVHRKKFVFFCKTKELTIYGEMPNLWYQNIHFLSAQLPISPSNFHDILIKMFNFYINYNVKVVFPTNPYDEAER